MVDKNRSFYLPGNYSYIDKAPIPDWNPVGETLQIFSLREDGEALYLETNRHIIMKTCESCKYFQPPCVENMHPGQCHRNPPSHDGWPRVMDKEWCGEWAYSPLKKEPMK